MVKSSDIGLGIPGDPRGDFHLKRTRMLIITFLMVKPLKEANMRVIQALLNSQRLTIQTQIAPLITLGMMNV